MSYDNTQVVTAEMSVVEVFEAITSALRRSTDGILEAADCMVQFEGAKNYTALKKKLTDEKVMGVSTISQYMTIGKCKVLKANIEHIPASFNSIYHLAKLEKEEEGFIERAIENGKLCRSTKLETIRKWGDRKSTGWVSVSIDIDANVSKEIREKIRMAAMNAAKEMGACVKPESLKMKASKKGVQ